MLEIKIEASSIEGFRAHVAELYSMVFGALNERAHGPAIVGRDPAPVAETVEPAKRTRKPKGTDGVTAETVPAPQQAAAPPVTAESLFSVETVAAPAKQPEQKDLISAFRTLNEKKGTNAIVGLLGKYGAATVAKIPKDKWAEAIAEAQKLAA